MLAILFIALTPRPSGAEPAGDDCVAKPNSAAPQGSHWYYRVDRTANRRCWFLGPEGLKVRQAESPKRLLSTTSTPQLNSENRVEAAASESVANVSTSPSSSKGLRDREPSSTNDNADEHTTANFGAAAEVSANAAPAEQAPEVPLGVRAAAPAPAEDASISVWPEQMLATGAGVLALITVVLLIMYRPFGIQKLAGKPKSRAQGGTKTVHRRKALSPAPASNIAAGRQGDFIRGPLARPRAFSATREPLNLAQPTHDIEKDLRWLLDRSQRRAA